MTLAKLTDLLASALEPNEREAVLGDLAESGENSLASLRSVMGLVLRRQAVHWRHPQPWLVLTVVVIPLGMLLTRFSRSTAYGSSIYLWLYINNWTPAYLSEPAYRYDMFRYLGAVAGSLLELACVSPTPPEPPPNPPSTTAKSSCSTSGPPGAPAAKRKSPGSPNSTRPRDPKDSKS